MALIVTMLLLGVAFVAAQTLENRLDPKAVLA
jgi:hypothetical protein